MKKLLVIGVVLVFASACVVGKAVGVTAKATGAALSTAGTAVMVVTRDAPNPSEKLPAHFNTQED